MATERGNSATSKGEAQATRRISSASDQMGQAASGTSQRTERNSWSEVPRQPPPPSLSETSWCDGSLLRKREAGVAAFGDFAGDTSQHQSLNCGAGTLERCVGHCTHCEVTVR